jgi:L-lactate dehydrogenase complex protein LldG
MTPSDNMEKEAPGRKEREWLDRLVAESLAKQEQWMDRIAEKLGRRRLAEPPVRPFRGAPDFWQQHASSREETIRTFIAHFQAAGGRVVKAGTMDGALDLLAEEIRRRHAKRVIIAGQPELRVLKETAAEAEVTVWNEAGAAGSRDAIAKAAEADIGVIIADYAVAATGSIVVASSPAKGRSVSLLPPALFAVVPVSRLKSRLGEVFADFDGMPGGGGLPAGIHFISGPSRSADIENDLTIGVHGPGEVLAVLVEDAAD